MNYSVIIQARMGSTRLPGKVLLPLEGMPVLWHVINRLKYSKLTGKIIVATTDLQEDDQIENFCLQNETLFFRGSSEDVLSRYYHAGVKFGADAIIRVTSDCPLIDPQIIDSMIEVMEMLNSGNDKVDYLSNVHPRTFPRGLDTEIFTFASLEKAYNHAESKPEREHVTPYLHQNPKLFKTHNYSSERDYSFHRWTVDTPEDYILLQRIFSALYKKDNIFYMNEILDLFNSNPDLIKINQHIQQKETGK